MIEILTKGLQLTSLLLINEYDRLNSPSKLTSSSSSSSSSLLQSIIVFKSLLELCNSILCTRPLMKYELLSVHSFVSDPFESAAQLIFYVALRFIVLGESLYASLLEFIFN